ncbi:MAG: serine/threonine protein kinase [bacterium]|nr:serine/threonine protein kinase [bacterium]
MCSEDPDSTSLAPPAEDFVGRIIDNNFEILGLLGAGGMGQVYRALDLQLDREVALKMVSKIDAQDKVFVARFEREARAASAVNHPNVAQVYSIGRHDGGPYYAMELVEGESLDAILANQGPLAPSQAYDLLKQACEGLQAANERGVIHRDLKPSNLMLSSSGLLKVVDFGLARRVNADQTLTQTGNIVGTPAFMPPEQALSKDLDQRSDIYALGATFFQLLSGQAPFTADTPLEVVTKHLHEPPPILMATNPAIPSQLSAIVQKMLAKSPKNRFQTYDELLNTIERAKQGGEARISATLEPSSARFHKPQPTPSLRLTPVILVIALGLIVGLPLYNTLTKDPPQDIESPVGQVTITDASSPEKRKPQAPIETLNSSARRDSEFYQQPRGSFEESTPQMEPPTLAEAVPYRSAAEPSIAYQQSVDTMSVLSRLTTAVEDYRARNGRLPQILDALHSSYGDPFPPRDEWGHLVNYKLQGDMYIIASPGPDGTLRTPDDVVFENGRKVDLPGHGGPQGRRPPPRRQ